MLYAACVAANPDMAANHRKLRKKQKRFCGILWAVNALLLVLIPLGMV